MIRESNLVLRSLLVGTRKYSQKQKLNTQERMDEVLKSIISELRKQQISMKIVSPIPKTLIKDLKIKDGIIYKDDLDYAWQKPEINRKMHIHLSPTYKTMEEDTLAYILATYIEDGVVLITPEFTMFEVIIFNKEISEHISLNKSLFENIESLQTNYIEKPKVTLIKNAFNNKKENLFGININVTEYCDDEVSPIIEVLLRKADLFYGIVNSNVATWIAMLCVAAGVKCELRQIYLEDAVNKEQNIDTSPFLERALTQNSQLPIHYAKILNEVDVCKSHKVHAYILPLKRNKGILKKHDNKQFLYLRCYDQQVFRIQK